MLLPFIDFRLPSNTSETGANISHNPFAREIYQTYCTGACIETDMGWLLELLEGMYSNEMKLCMKATLKAEEE